MLLDSIYKTIEKGSYSDEKSQILKEFVEILFKESSNTDSNNFKLEFLLMLYDKPLIKYNTISFILKQNFLFIDAFEKEHISIIDKIDYLNELNKRSPKFGHIPIFKELLNTDYFDKKDIVQSFKVKLLSIDKYTLSVNINENIDSLALNCFIKLIGEDKGKDNSNYLNAYNYFMSLDDKNELKLKTLIHYVNKYNFLGINAKKYDFVLDYIKDLNDEQKGKLWIASRINIEIFRQIFSRLGDDFLLRGKHISSLITLEKGLLCKLYLFSHLPDGYIEKNFKFMLSTLSKSFNVLNEKKILLHTHLFFENIKPDSYNQMKDIHLKESIEKNNYYFFKTLFNYIHPKNLDPEFSSTHLLIGFLKNLVMDKITQSDEVNESNGLKRKELFLIFCKYLPENYNISYIYRNIINILPDCFEKTDNIAFINDCISHSNRLNESSLNDIFELIQERYPTKQNIIDTFLHFKDHYLGVKKINKIKLKMK